MRCENQLRPGPGRGVIGFDMGAFFAVGGALKVPLEAMAIFLPEIEMAATAAINRQVEANSDG
jgi:hypothetical protein